MAEELIVNNYKSLRKNFTLFDDLCSKDDIIYPIDIENVHISKENHRQFPFSAFNIVKNGECSENNDFLKSLESLVTYTYHNKLNLDFLQSSNFFGILYNIILNHEDIRVKIMSYKVMINVLASINHNCDISDITILSINIFKNNVVDEKLCSCAARCLSIACSSNFENSFNIIASNLSVEYIIHRLKSSQGTSLRSSSAKLLYYLNEFISCEKLLLNVKDYIKESLKNKSDINETIYFIWIFLHKINDHDFCYDLFPDIFFYLSEHVSVQKKRVNACGILLFYCCFFRHFLTSKNYDHFDITPYLFDKITEYMSIDDDDILRNSIFVFKTIIKKDYIFIKFIAKCSIISGISNIIESNCRIKTKLDAAHLLCKLISSSKEMSLKIINTNTVSVLIRFLNLIDSKLIIRTISVLENLVVHAAELDDSTYHGFIHNLEENDLFGKIGTLSRFGDSDVSHRATEFYDEFITILNDRS